MEFIQLKLFSIFIEFSLYRLDGALNLIPLQILYLKHMIFHMHLQQQYPDWVS